MHPVSPHPIRALPDDLINQIAAGEVIERPASIVKELLENSLDAGASAIRIEVDGGGIERIAVTDDGHGIAADDLVLALERHCTSKVSVYDDLAAITSLGFRGEALASIGAVAEVNLISRRAEDPHAWHITTGPRQRGGQPRPISGATGTTITVRDLFATVPVRRQFLRRAQTELLHIQQLLRALAFCVPAVALTLVCDRSRTWLAPATRDERSALLRWRAVFGAEFARDARYVDIQWDGMRVYGWVGPAALARSQNDLQFVAVNGRLIRDRQIAHGIRIAYGSEVPAGRNPTYALHIEIPPMEVDVNVHPTKSEVRFKRLRDVHDLIYSATRQALREPLVVTATPGAPNQHARQSTLTDSTPSHTRSTVTQAIRAFSNAPTPSAMQQGNALVGARYSVTQDAREQWLVWDLVRWFEQLLETLGPTPEVRLLMIPVRLPTPPPASVLQVLKTLARVGFEVTEVAPERWVLRGVPAVLPDFDPRIFVEQLLRVDDPITAAVALAAACELPTDLRARATRLAEWAALATSRGIAPGKYQRTLGPEMLAGIFAGPAGV